MAQSSLRVSQRSAGTACKFVRCFAEHQIGGSEERFEMALSFQRLQQILIAGRIGAVRRGAKIPDEAERASEG